MASNEAIRPANAQDERGPAVELQHALQRLTSYMENSPLGAIEWDGDLRITRWNREAESIFGWKSVEMVGQSIDSLPWITESERLHVRGLLTDLLHGSKLQEIQESCNLHKSGRVVHCQWFNSPLTVADDQPSSLLSLCLNVTTQKQAETALRRSEAELRRLNTTLERQIVERTALAERRASQLRALAARLTQTEHRERRRLAKILHEHLMQLLVAARMKANAALHRNSNGLSGLLQEVDDLLHQSIIEARSVTVELSPPVLYDAGLAVALAWLARRMREKHGLSVTLEFSSAAEPETDDLRTFLFGAIRELLLNVARHAKTDCATVRVAAPAPRWIEVEVSDFGQGFDATSDPTPGAILEGYGLFALREALELVGGRLQVRAARGKGTSVQFAVPRPMPLANSPASVVTEQISSESLNQHTQQPPRAIRIVLAEDHPLLREGLADLLSSEADIEVVGKAANGCEAVEMTLQCSPDVVLMDVVMPELDGLEATRRIRAAMPNVVVMGLSLNSEKDMAEAMRLAGAAGYLIKDGSSEDLVAAIRRCGVMTN